MSAKSWKRFKKKVNEFQIGGEFRIVNENSSSVTDKYGVVEVTAYDDSKYKLSSFFSDR